ncbi:hypothetical protein [Anoxybacillus ayderensis]|nr:hypothetical protein [Anoxybacillus ayderensis]MED0657066.1 hypothetical protein [Anoxybacillus ayderensis]MED0685328.1 hypothetical protein [Anoxybacillus ayderensis]
MAGHFYSPFHVDNDWQSVNYRVAQAVFLSTLLSPVTVASVIGIAHVYF